VNRRLYWVGNIAKTRIIDDILAAHPASAPMTIFDYGCGDGGDWNRILSDYAHIRLVGYEPHEPSAARSRASLRGLSAEIFTADTIQTLALAADYIVSFSVFEHVVDRRQFLAHAKRLLAPAGVFYLNYDDGHFRNRLDVAQIDTWLPALRSFARTLASGPAAAMGRPSKYQRRVAASKADSLVVEAGFCIERSDYHNLIDLKELAKTMPEDQREAYARWWLAAELELNARFRFDLARPRYGDTANLWQQMVTRTLTLRHAVAR
jgi:SAM-dependent methyltransferase